MDYDKYILEPWKEYDVVDNGVFAPKGSNPKFCAAGSLAMRYDCNPIHPLIQGYITHDQMPGTELMRKRRLFINDIILPKK